MRIQGTFLSGEPINKRTKAGHVHLIRVHSGVQRLDFGLSRMPEGWQFASLETKIRFPIDIATVLPPLFYIAVREPFGFKPFPARAPVAVLIINRPLVSQICAFRIQLLYSGRNLL